MKKLIIDYFNVGLFPVLFSLSRGVHITYLFKAKNRAFESFVISFLQGNGVTVEYRRLISDRSYKLQSDKSDMVAESLLKQLTSKVLTGTYFKQRVGDIVYSSTYRIASIVSFIELDKGLDGYDEVYISKSRYYRIFANLYDNNRFHFYLSFGKPEERGYQPFYRVNRNNSLIDFANGAYHVMKSMLMISLSKWPENMRLDAVLYTHMDVEERRYLKQSIIENSVERKGIVRNNFSIDVNDGSYKIRRLALYDVLPYFKHLLKGLSIFQDSNISIGNRFLLFSDWVDLFYLQQMINKLQCKVAYSVYESNAALLLLYAATVSKKCISLASSFSAGYFPMTYHISHRAKNIDCYLVWGQYLSELYVESGDRSKFHVCVGYIGDHYKQEFIQNAQSFFQGENAPIVAIYDTTYFDDLFVNELEMYNFVLSITDFAISKGAKVIVKTKKGSELYNGLVNKYPDDVILDKQLGSLSPSIAANLVIGFLSSTPVIVAKAWNKNVVFYDPQEMTWTAGSKYLSNDLVKSSNEVCAIISNLVTNSATISEIMNQQDMDVSRLDNFSDGKSQKRVADYISYILGSTYVEKSEILEDANEKYKQQWGHENIVNVADCN